MSLSPEEMFYLATGLLDLDSWTATNQSQVIGSNNNNNKNKEDSRTNRVSSAGQSRCDPSEEDSTACAMSAQPRLAKGGLTLSPLDSSCPSSLLPQSATCSRPSIGSAPISNWSSSSAYYKSSSSTSPRRPSWPTVYFTMLLILMAFTLQTAEGCSSRSTPKPRPPPPLPSPTPAVRPNITFQTYACPPAYATYYCLNGATCFTIKIGESILYNCECTEGFMGQRCEYKDLDGSYLPLREKIMLERASIAGGATVAVVLVVIISIIFYTYVRQQRKEQRLSFEQVTVEKIQAKGRSLSSCNHNLAPCRFGVASIKNHSFLLHQQRLQLSLPVDCKKAIQPNLRSPDAHFVRVHHLASLTSNPLNLTQGSINMMPANSTTNVTNIVRVDEISLPKGCKRDQTVILLPNDWSCKPKLATST